MKALFHEVVGKRTLEASESDTSKKARTEEVSVRRADNSSSEFDPTDIVELSNLHQGQEEPFFPSVFDDSEVCGPKISEKPVQKGYRGEDERFRGQISHA